MAKDPAMLFYTKDFLTGVAFLSMKERGQYITLLCYQQQLGHMSRQQMETAVGKLSPGLWAKFVEDEQGLWYNVRADVEIGKRRTHCEKQRETIMKRWNKTPADDTTVYTTEDTVEIPRNNHGITVVDTTVIPLANANGIYKPKTKYQVEKERTEEVFNQFWEVYPKKVAKKAARKAFDKVPASEYPKLVPAVEAQKKSLQWHRDKGQYIPNPATWLNQGRWDDEAGPEGKEREPKMAGSGKTGTVDIDELEKFLENMGG